MILRVLLWGVLSGPALAALAGCAAQKAAPVSRPPVAYDTAAPAQSVDGATLILLDRGEALYFSSKLATFLTMAERRDVFRRLIGREVALEGAFLARRTVGGDVQDLGGIAAATSAHEGGVALAYIRTFANEDRVVDFFARDREMRAVSLTGFGDDISCLVTDWVSSKQTTFSARDFERERCRLVQGRAFAIQ